jgi:hypothetical protein
MLGLSYRPQRKSFQAKFFQKNNIDMAWDPKYPAFGVVKIEGRNIKIYNNSGTYVMIQSIDAVSAQWAGNVLNVTMKDGKVRRYPSQSTYSTI